MGELPGMLFLVAFIHARAMADDDTTATNSWTPENSRFGLFNSLDHRSGYYEDCFPEPLLMDETSLEPNGELELTSWHTEASGQQSDSVGAQVEKSFDLVTFELEVPYERDSDEGDVSEGVGDIELNARCPFYQFVSANGFFDTTMGLDVDAGIPVNSAVSKNAELEPGVFNDLKLGNHFTIQTVLQYSTLFGGGDDGGSQSFEYGFDFACTLPRAELPIPGVRDISPMLELDGEWGLNQDEAGQNSVLGGLGFRLDFKPLCGLESSLGLGYVFPVDSLARAEVHWGVATSLTFEF